MPLYAATIFVSAFLLFLVQPLIARYILPWFGGSPSVWTTCMLFFQVLLLAGYAYADGLTRWVGGRVQIWLHLALLVVALILLPIIPAETWKPTGEEPPVPLILGLLLSTIGMQYFLLSATGPLVQAWFAARYPGRSPYRLYALSNVGSLLALLAYPFGVESLLGTRPQAIAWSWGFGLFAALIAGTGIQSLRAVGKPVREAMPEAATESQGNGPVAAGGNWFTWLILSTIPSILLLAITNQLCQESATIPFLWILPLSLYLLSFIICFDAPRWYHRETYFLLTVFLTAAVIGLMRQQTAWQLLVLPAYLFFASMFCHGELARQKPATGHLTLFYLMISIGGALGGVFVVLVAPWIFDRFYELHVALLAVLLIGLWSLSRQAPERLPRIIQLIILVGFALALRLAVHYSTDLVAHPWAQISLVLAWVALGIAVTGWMAWRSREYLGLADKSVKKRSGLKRAFAWLSLVLWLGTGGVLVASILWGEATIEFVLIPLQVVFVMLVISILIATDFAWPQFFLRGSWLSIGLLLAIVTGFLGLDILTPTYPGTLVQRRGFYGLTSVTADDSVAKDKNGVGRVLMLYSGRIQHGYQYTGEKYRKVKTTYYGIKSGAGRVMAHLPQRSQRGIEMGVIGLGIGTMAMWGQPGDRITFFEINPINLQLAEEYFTCLPDSDAETRVRLGDGRLMLEKEMQREDFRPYDVFVVDAFTGDSIPRHLLTRECFELYSRALADDGVLLIHVSHRHFELARVVYPLAEAIGCQACTILSEIKGTSEDFFENQSEWIVVTRNRQLLENPDFAQHITSRSGGRPVVWTDDFGSMVQVLKVLH